MSDSIYRQEAIDALDQILDRCEEIEAHLPKDDPNRTGYKMYPDYMTVLEYLHQLPSAEPERKTGRWTETCEFHGDTNVVSHKALACSVCNVAFIGGYGYGIKEMLEDFRYCPNCGAKMEEDHVQDTPQ